MVLSHLNGGSYVFSKSKDTLLHNDPNHEINFGTMLLSRLTLIKCYQLFQKRPFGQLKSICGPGFHPGSRIAFSCYVSGFLQFGTFFQSALVFLKITVNSFEDHPSVWVVWASWTDSGRPFLVEGLCPPRVSCQGRRCLLPHCGMLILVVWSNGDDQVSPLHFPL